MNKILIDDIDTENSCMRFDVRPIEYIEVNGFPATIGRNASNVEETEKVFFSIGIKGVLDLIDVWLIWRMNKDHYHCNGWRKDFLSENYLFDDEKKNITFSNMKKWLLDRNYYLVDLNEGIDYYANDIDEAKESAIKSREEGNILRYLMAQQMYKGKTDDFDIPNVEKWNMHTISQRGISVDKISLLVTPDGESDALSVIQYLYSNFQEKKDFRLLNEFLGYVKKSELSEETKRGQK